MMTPAEPAATTATPTPRDEAVVAFAAMAKSLADAARGMVPTAYDEWRSDPVSFVHAVLTVQDDIMPPLLARAMLAARESGATWEDLGRVAGITRQSAHARWADVEKGWRDHGRRMQDRHGPVDVLPVAARLDEWYTRGRDGGDPVVTGPRGLRAVSDGLDATPPTDPGPCDDRPPRPATTAAMRRALQQDTGHEFSTSLLRMVLAFPPVDLLADALEDGWDAPGVRTQLLDAIARQLIQRPWPTDPDERPRALTKMIAADRRFPDYERGPICPSRSAT